MEKFDFQLLSEAEQLDEIYKNGVYLDKRKIGNATAVLYQYHNFYIEIVYRKYRLYTIRIRCFESTDLLIPYLEKMDIYELMNC